MIARLTLIFAALCAGTLRADDSFTKALSPEDFQAAGLNKLTPDELARLDALIRGEKAGAVAKAKEETAQVVTAAVTEKVTAAVTEKVTAAVTASVAETVRQQVKAEDQKAEQKKAASAGFIERMKVVLKPGTEIEYTTLDALLVPPFHGWQKDTILRLTNGQRWIVTDDGNYWADLTEKPVHVRVVPGTMGGFFMEIEKGGRPKVRFLGNSAPQPTPTPTPQ
jgi:hypothetical protein